MDTNFAIKNIEDIPQQLIMAEEHFTKRAVSIKNHLSIVIYQIAN